MPKQPEIALPAQQDLPYVVRELMGIVQDLHNRISLLEFEIYRLGGFRNESSVN